MTEAEWNACTDPTPMLAFLRGKASDRKLRLSAVTCCRRIWDVLTDTRSRTAVEISERYADSQGLERRGMRKELTRVRREARVAVTDTVERPLEQLKGGDTEAAAAARGASEERINPDILQTILHSAQEARMWQAWVTWREAHEETARRTKERAWTKVAGGATNEEGDSQCRVLRDIFGNPFRLVTIDSVWLPSTVMRHAESIYQERAFDQLPILADALEDAGCNNADILNHCRHPGEHVRGCWVIDLLTGRE